MMLDATFEKLFRFISIRPRSEKEVKDWFARKKIPQKVAEELFGKAKKAKLVDDEAFSLWWVEQRQAFKLFSKNRIRMELLAKGVAKETIDEALKNIQVDEKNKALKSAERKLSRLGRYPYDQKRKKVINHLKGAGFSWEVIKDVLEELKVDGQDIVG